jgi:hypothetical protein
MLEVEHCIYQLLVIKDNENNWENEKKIQSMGDTWAQHNALVAIIR